MGYVAVKGGLNAIEASIRRLNYNRVKDEKVIQVDQIEGSMKGLIDVVMSEASFYSKELAALAIKQATGNVEEAVFLLRAFRSTLERKYYTREVNTRDMWVERRISASFKDIVGGQILGATYDYTHRLLDFNLEDEKQEDIQKIIDEFNNKNLESLDNDVKLNKLPKVLDYLRKEKVMIDFPESKAEPKDITKVNLEFPTERSERLQILTRGDTGGVKALAYSALRTSGVDNHPNVGELRVGKIPLYIDENEDELNDYYIGEIEVTEVESFIPIAVKDENGQDVRKLEIGYGLCYGQNESKAIAMSILDNCLNRKDPKFPTGNEEFVLMSIDSVESAGFISHLKLPHYVTFQSELDSLRRKKEGKIDEE